MANDGRAHGAEAEERDGAARSAEDDAVGFLLPLQRSDTGFHLDPAEDTPRAIAGREGAASSAAQVDPVPRYHGDAMEGSQFSPPRQEPIWRPED